MKVIDRDFGVRLDAVRTNGAIRVEVQMLDFDAQKIPENGHMEKCSAMSPPEQRSAKAEFSIPSGPAPTTQKEKFVDPGFKVIVKRTRVE